MPTIGLDCHLILDGQGYWIEPASFKVARPRVRSATLNRTMGGSVGAGERTLDQGPGKREWTFIVLAFQAIRDYTGAFITTTGQQYRDALHTSYNKLNTPLAFTDPHSTVWSVRFDNLDEEIVDVHAQADGELQYFMHVALVEA